MGSYDDPETQTHKSQTKCQVSLLTDAIFVVYDIDKN